MKIFAFRARHAPVLSNCVNHRVSWRARNGKIGKVNLGSNRGNSRPETKRAPRWRPFWPAQTTGPTCPVKAGGEPKHRQRPFVGVHPQRICFTRKPPVEHKSVVVWLRDQMLETPNIAQSMAGPKPAFNWIKPTGPERSSQRGAAESCPAERPRRAFAAVKRNWQRSSNLLCRSKRTNKNR